MIVSLKWLKEYIDLEGITTEEIVDKLTTSGSEVDEVIDKTSEFENIIVGLVESVEKHPNADKLSLCKVSDGNESYNVVCGAPNVAAGQKVPFAKVGAIIPNGKFEIKSAKIRGEKSYGMICAEDELGLGDDHSGIMVLDDNAIIGDPLSKALKLDDVILDVAITPNRADSLSHIGLARDLAALFNIKIKYPNTEIDHTISQKNQYAEIIVENIESCPRYSAIIVKDTVVMDSPEWLKDKLISIGLRPINNIVDVTNFVLHEMGQPLHAFDLSKIEKSKIIVKNSTEEFEFVSLDSKKRSMLQSDLMICDGNKPVAIAGVMGGENSEVSSETTDLLIESAYFDKSSVRKTAKRLSLSSDASYRFERGTDPNGTLKAAIRAANLIVEIAGGKIINEFIDIYPKLIEQKVVSARFSRINQILGFSIDKDKITEIFTGLEFKVINSTDTEITVSIPTFRHDIEREIDLIEEVVRIYGFDKVPPIDKLSISLIPKVDQTSFEDSLRYSLTSLGFNEVISNSLISDEKTIRYPSSIKVLNPQSLEMSRLRTSLIPGLLLNISRNLKIKENGLRFFEIGDVFEQLNKEIKSFDDFKEKENLIIAVCGNKNIDEWYQKESFYDFHDLKGTLDNIFNINDILDSLDENVSEIEDEIFEYSSVQHLKGEQVSVSGKVKSELLEKFEISKDVYIAEINIDLIKSFSKNNKKYSPLLKFPKVYRDFGFILDKKISYNEVVKTINESSSELLKKVNLFDIFESESMGLDKKSFAFQLEYYNENRTLREDEIDEEFWKTIESIKTKLNAELRGK
ncbi:MAG: phenylalanine--tRNA ligase subunit beta [Melioribacteraceae bacterium]|nr:phenylalanine--tRNA ligase subunit beta [Melioribacteraceae bacterium]